MKVNIGTFQFPGQEAERSEMFEEMEKYDLTNAVALLVFVFYCQNKAIGAYTRQRGLSGGDLAQNELRWLYDPQGALAFSRRHRVFFEFMCEHYGAQLSMAWMFAQILILHEDMHHILVKLAYGRTPTNNELADLDDKEGKEEVKRGYRARLRARFLLMTDVEEFQREVSKMKMGV